MRTREDDDVNDVEDIAAYEKTGDAATKSKHAVVQAKHKVTGKDYHAKPETNFKTAQTELGTQNLIAALWKHNPETTYATDSANPAIVHVVSETVQGFTSLHDLLVKYGTAEVVRRIEKGIYKGFGNVIVMALLTNEADLHQGNIGIDKDGTFVKIDGDWSNARLRYGNTPGYAFTITPEVYAALPKLDHVKMSYIPHHWFEQFQAGVLTDEERFLHAVMNCAKVKAEIHEQTLKCLLMPTQYIQNITQGVAVQGNKESVYLENCSEHIKARIQLCQSACKNADFCAYFLDEDKVRKVKNELADALSIFKIMGQKPFEARDLAEEFVESRFEVVKEMVFNLDANYGAMVAHETAAIPDFDIVLLQTAIKSGDLALTEAICSNNNDIVNQADENGCTPFLEAINSNKQEIVNYFLTEHEPNYSAELDNGYDAILLAARSGNMNILASVVKGINDVDYVNNQTTKTGKSALMIAAERGHIDVLKFMIQNRADPRLKDKEEMSALYYAAINGHLAAVKVLLNIPIVLSGTSKSQIKNAFRDAMHNQKFDTAKELVDRFGLDKLESSMSCLNRLVICAAHFGDEALFKKVMAKKPDDLNALLANDATALIEAAKCQAYSIFNELINKSGINIKQCDADGRSAFDYLVEHGKLSIAIDFAEKYKLIDEVVNNKNENRLIHYAVQNHDLSSIAKLITSGADLQVKNKEAQTPLMLAVKNGFIDAAEALLNTNKIVKSDINAALLLAVEHGHTDLAKKLLEQYGADINRVSSDARKYTPLILAVRAGNNGLVDYILARHDFNSFNHQDQEGYTAFSSAAERKQWDTVRKLAMDDKVDITIPNSAGKTGLNYLAEQDLELCVQVLVHHKMPNYVLDAATKVTALHMVVGHEFDDLIRLLIKAGADVNAKTATNETPLLSAAMMDNAVVMERLLQHGAEASINVADGKGKTPLSVAVSNQNDAVVDKMLATGVVDFDGARSPGVTAFGMALFSSHSAAICNTFIRHGFNVNTVFNEATGDTLLHHAVRNNEPDAIEYLCRCKVDFNARNGAGKTAAQVALQVGNQYLSDRLIKLYQAAEKANYAAKRTHVQAPVAAEGNISRMGLDRPKK